MNAPDTFVQLLARTRESFPASTKSYITGSRSDLRVPVRDIALTNGEVVSVYDTSGPYTDPAATIDVKKGLQSVRAAWIAERGDTEQYEGRKPVALDDGRQSEDAARLAQLRQEAAALQRQPRRAKAGANVTQMHYAKKGIITPEMEYVALRENGKREWMAQYQQDAAREQRGKLFGGSELGVGVGGVHGQVSWFRWRWGLLRNGPVRPSGGCTWQPLGHGVPTGTAGTGTRRSALLPPV